MFFLKRGFAPLKLPFLIQKWGEEILEGVNSFKAEGRDFGGANSSKAGEEILGRGEAPPLPTLPLPLVREGGQGDRFPNNI